MRMGRRAPNFEGYRWAQGSQLSHVWQGGGWRHASPEERIDWFKQNRSMGRNLPARIPMAERAAKTEATKARSMGRFLRGKRGLAVGGGALAFGMYEAGRNRSTGRNGLSPNASGGGGVY